MGCSPWGREESDMTGQPHFHFSLSCTGEGNGNPLQYSCLENPREGSLVGCCLWGRTESDTTELLHFHFHFHALEKEMAPSSSVLAWRIPGKGAWWAAVYGVSQSQTRLK